MADAASRARGAVPGPPRGAWWRARGAARRARGRTSGVTGAVVGLVTGAAGPGGFKGLGGRFVRRGLRSYGVPMTGELRLTRVDNGASVELAFHADGVPMSDTLRATTPRAVQPDADAATRAAFGGAWQARVRAIVVDHADDPRVVEIVG